MPAYFDDAQRQATRDAGRSPAWKWSAWSTSRRRPRWPTAWASAKQLDPATAAQGNGSPAKPAASPGGISRVWPGPVPRAADTGRRRDEESLVAVYDLGGGTFDISVLRLCAGVCRGVSTHGDTQLGGDDFDREIMSLI